MLDTTIVHIQVITIAQQMYISLGLVSLCVFCCSAQSHFSKILLQNVDKIVLREGQMTNARRVSPIPQLRCVGGSAGCRSAPTPNLVICSNIGSQGGEVRWECEADFDQRYRFGRVQVSCEGYEHPDDTYILKDSCGLEYEIDEKYSQPSLISFTNVFLIAAIGFLLYLLYQDCLEVDTTAPRPPTTLTTRPLDAIRLWFGSLIERLYQIFIAPIVNKCFQIFITPVLDKFFEVLIAPVIEELVKVMFSIFTLPFRAVLMSISQHYRNARVETR